MDASPALPPESDTARTQTATKNVDEAPKNGKDPISKSDRPRNSKGWDGKLRLGLVKSGEDDQAESEGEQSEEEGDEGLPPEQIAADEDLLEDVPDEEEEIDLVHFKVSSIPALRLERFKKLTRLCLRQNQISSVDIPPELATTLTEIDLYDNLIAHIKGFDAFIELTSLDLSFNKIKHIKRINHLKKLKDLYFVQNKISTIENLEGLDKLRQLELGANRIRTIENLESLTALEELWLGKNKIPILQGLHTLTNLKILSVQSNRLTSITGLGSLTLLEELYISHNQLTSITGLEANQNLRVLDISNNPVENLANLEANTRLEEFWASYCKLSDFKEVETELRDKKDLQTVYFEGNPLQIVQPALYRNKVKLALPQVSQIDATFVKAV